MYNEKSYVDQLHYDLSQLVDRGDHSRHDAIKVVTEKLREALRGATRPEISELNIAASYAVRMGATDYAPLVRLTADKLKTH